MRFAHIADVHLGRCPDVGTRWEREAYGEIYDGFEKFIDYLDINPVDFLFITGDLFDEIPDTKALTYVDDQLSKLRNTNIIYVTGEKDYLKKGACIWEYRFMSNLYLLNCETFNNGVPEDKRAVRTKYAEGLVDCVYFEKFNMDIYGVCQYAGQNSRNDLDTIYVRDKGRINILLAHGGDMDVCPFDREDFKSKGFEYVGLGHFHNYTVYEEGRIYYPGSLNPLAPNEQGEHGFIKGYVDKLISDIKFVPFADRKYASYDIQADKDMDDAKLADKITDICGRDKHCIYSFRLVRDNGCMTNFSTGGVRQKYRILDIEGERYGGVDAATLEMLNSDNVIGENLRRLLGHETGIYKKAADYYAGGIMRIIWGDGQPDAESCVADKKVAEMANSRLMAESEVGLAEAKESIALCGKKKEELTDDKAEYDRLTGKLNTLRAEYGMCEFELSKVDFEDSKINQGYSMRRIGFITRMDFPFVIALVLIATAGAILAFVARRWNTWLNIIIALILGITAITIISFHIYNITARARKRLLGERLPVERHAELANKRNGLEKRMHELETEIYEYETEAKRLKSVNERFKKLEKIIDELNAQSETYEAVCEKQKNLALILE